MKPTACIQTFTDRYPLMGPAIWMSCIQFYIVQLAVALAYHGNYSWKFNVISDLGNSVCALYGNSVVCSPWHNLMNLSFVSLGLTMIVGSLFVYQEFRETRISHLGFSAMTVAGFGSILVGIFPENTIGALHFIGALLSFLIGNIGLVVLGMVLPLPRLLRLSTLYIGVIALIALGLYFTNHYLGLGAGGMERLIAYPQTIWMILFGIYVSANHYQKAKPGKRTK